MGLSAEHMRRLCSGSHRKLVDTLEKHYKAELARLSPEWYCAGDSPLQPRVDVTEAVGLPGVVLGAILAGKCRDQKIPVNPERQQ